ncbi:MAG: hypothetical protein V4550_05910 [Gemmatimonadota bacterium]
MADESIAARRTAMRRATLHLVLGIIILDAVALGAYKLFDIQFAPYKTQVMFTVGWTVATALVVAFLLKRVRALRGQRR